MIYLIMKSKLCKKVIYTSVRFFKGLSWLLWKGICIIFEQFFESYIQSDVLYPNESKDSNITLNMSLKWWTKQRVNALKPMLPIYEHK
jgi:hypothetical protein